MIKKIFITLALFISVNKFSLAQLNVINKTDKTIYLGLTWYDEDEAGYFTKGWYAIEPGETITPGLTFTSDADFFYYYASTEDNSNVWAGEDKFYAKNDEDFYVEYSSNDEMYYSVPGYVSLPFVKQMVNFNNGEKKYTLELTGADNSDFLSEEYEEEAIESYDLGIKLMGFLMFEDGSISDFNVINNNDIALWNTIIGEGSATKSSKKTKFKISIPKKTEYNKIEISVQDENVKLLYRSEILNASSNALTKEFVINDTGCSKLEINVTQFFPEGNVKLIQAGNINFECGE